ncbi:hemerythrin domain-containing protein [Sphingopyxis kveilinensis]|uniref:hemerythrin domain-containing protein n=1 Tax=Sphingopyxis kveilinensis TaxID=3114367 RepID=UPI0030D1863F
MSREMERLRAEHAALIALARIILAMMKEPAPARLADLASARRALGETLVRHLKCEDWALYPRLRTSGEPELVRVTRDFELEMGDLADDFAAYDGKWTAERVAADWDGFRRETMIVFDLLKLRIEREERELYPLADRLYLAAAPMIAPGNAPARLRD